MKAEREKLIRETWERRHEWIGDWNPKQMPRYRVLPRPDAVVDWRKPSTAVPLGTDYLTFEHARVCRTDRYGFRIGPEVFDRITCEGIELYLDLAPDMPLKRSKPA